MNREKALSRLRSEDFDLLVIGGGITGVGVALDAQTRGLKVALVEKNDFASGTSSRSTKLIHGGLRYLKQFEFKLVNEVGRERAIVHKLAPHLVHPDKMLLPLIKDGNYGYLLTSMGLSVYDILAGVEGNDKRKMLDKNEASSMEPLLRTEDLEGAGFYAEYRTDDARLVMTLAKTAWREGAVLCNHIEAKEFHYNDDQKV
ncbi:MAG: FAD-dependent oxidoreductase, partial [Flavobacteriales bacterium]|nr:FAD-dependent oxidoreductase [Flavobacteriales bacterium]